ncbi:MAG: hypothetical protein HQK96_07900 [Nitrospirae bacterium]|nr:hypothetical protein [Nitrospirota bacterium]
MKKYKGSKQVYKYRNNGVIPENELITCMDNAIQSDETKREGIGYVLF